MPSIYRLLKILLFTFSTHLFAAQSDWKVIIDTDQMTNASSKLLVISQRAKSRADVNVSITCSVLEAKKGNFDTFGSQSLGIDIQVNVQNGNIIYSGSDYGGISPARVKFSTEDVRSISLIQSNQFLNIFFYKEAFDLVDFYKKSPGTFLESATRHLSSFAFEVTLNDGERLVFRDGGEYSKYIKNDCVTPYLAYLKKQVQYDEQVKNVRVTDHKSVSDAQFSKPDVDPSILNYYIGLMIRKIRNNFNTLPCFSINKEVVAKVQITNSGDILGTPLLVNATGNEACDTAVINAIVAAKPFDLPSDPLARSKMADLISLKFRVDRR